MKPNHRSLRACRSAHPLQSPLFPPAPRRHWPWLALSLALSTGSLQADGLLSWGPTGSGYPDGGNGFWNLIAPSWTADSGGSYQAWPVGGDNAAVFGGTQFSNIVTINGPITASGIRFQATNYDLVAGAGGTLLLATTTGAAPRITVEHPSFYATIDAPLAGTSGLRIDGQGTFAVTGANTLTGDIGITSGTLAQSGGSFVATNSVIMGATPTDGGAIGGRGTFALAMNSGTPANLAQSFASLQIASGDASIQLLGDSFGSVTTALTFDSLSRAAGSTAYFYIPYGANGTISKIALTSQATGFISPSVYANINDANGLDFAYRDAAGYVRPIVYGAGGDANTASVGTTTSITPGANLYFRTTGNVSAQATATMTTLKLGGNNFTLATSATLTVNGLLRTTGSTTLSGGTAIQAANNADLAVRTDFDPNTSAFTGNITINTPIVANGTNALVKSGGGLLVLGAANTYTGTTYVNGGILRLNNAAALPSGSNVQFNGGVLELTSTSPANFTIGTGPGQIQWIGDGGFSAFGSSHVVTLNGGAPLAWGDPGFVHNGNRLLLGSRVSNQTLSFTNPLDLGSSQRTIEVAGNAALPGIITGTGGLRLVSGPATSGTFQLTGVNTFSGGVRVEDVTLNLTTNNSLGTGPLTLAGIGGAFVTGSGTRAIPNDVFLGYSTNLGQQFGGSASFSLTLNGVIRGEPGAGFLQGGSNTLVLNGNNTFTGRADLNNGIVVVGHDHALGSGTFRLATTLQGDGVPHAISTAGTFWNCTIAGTSDLTFTNLFANDFGSDDTVTITNTGQTTFGAIGFSTDNTAHSVTFSTGTGASAAINGVISGGPLATGGGLIKAGVGTLAIGGSANTYTGVTTITGGVLAVASLTNTGAATSLGASGSAGANLIINGGTLRYTGAGDSTNRLFQIGNSGAGTGGTLDASGTGRVQFTNPGNIVYGTTNQTRTFTLTGTNPLDNTLASVLNNNGSGAVSVTKTGAGTWVLSANSAYTGATTITGGILKLGSAGSGANTPLGTTAGATTVSGGGTLDLGGYTLATSEPLTLSGNGAGSGGALINSSIAAAASYNGVVTLGAGGGSIGGSGDITLTAGLAANANALTKVGPGTLRLAGTSLATGPTLVSAGQLVVTGSIAASSLTTISAGATLAGTGTVGPTQIAGTLSPGLSPGTLNVSGDLTLQGGSTLQMEIGGLARGTAYDGLDITGGFTFGGTLQVTFINSFTATAGNTFNLFNSATTTGAFTSLLLPDLAPGLAWDTTPLASTGEITVVPEPATGTILLAGLAACLTARRRRSAA